MFFQNRFQNWDVPGSRNVSCIDTVFLPPSNTAYTAPAAKLMIKHSGCIKNIEKPMTDKK